MTIYIISSSSTAILSLLLGFFVLSKNRASEIHFTWFLTSMAVACWSTAILLLMVSPTSGSAELAGRFCNMSSALIPVFFTHFAYAITKTPVAKRKFLKIAYISGLIIVMSGFTPWFLTVKQVFNFRFYPVPRAFFYWMTLHFVLLCAYSEYLLIRTALLTEHLEEKNRLKYIIVATSLGFLSGTNYFLPCYGIPIDPVTPHLVWLYAVIISYAIVKLQLMDIRIVFRRGLVYSLLISFITAIYFIFVILTGQLFQSFIGLRSLPAAVVMFTVISIIFKPLERKIQSLVDKYVLRRSFEQLETENLLLRQQVQKTDQLKAVATLAAGMAHEIKNPLTSIKTFAEFLPEKYDDPEFRDKFKRIVSTEVDRVNNIVKQLLEFSKPQPPNLQKIDLTVVLDETLSLLGNNFSKNRIELVKNYTGPVEVLADKNQLKQAFLNIALNSIQAMKLGGTLTVRLTQNSGKAQISFEDTGCGINKDLLPHIFDPFFTTKESGTGLGLSIVHGIVKEHGGKIEVKSKAGEGTHILISLRLTQ